MDPNEFKARLDREGIQGVATTLLAILETQKETLEIVKELRAKKEVKVEAKV